MIENLDQLATKSFVKDEITTTKSFVKDEIHRLEITMYKAIFWAGLIQFLAIVGSIFAIINFMMHK